MDNDGFQVELIRREEEFPKDSAILAVNTVKHLKYFVTYHSPFVTMKFDWTIENYNVDVSSGFKSPPLRMYGKTVRFVLKRHRNEDDGTYYDSLGIRSDFRLYLFGSVKVNDDAEIKIFACSIKKPLKKVMVLVEKLRLIPKVRFLFDLQVDELLKKQLFSVEKKRVTKINADECRDNFVDDVRGLWQNPQFSDVTICTPDGKTIHAHKNILSARSPVFAAMFNHPTKENVQGVVEVGDVPFDHLERLVGFLYGHMPDVEGLPERPDLYALYFACDKYQVLDLRLLVAQTLVSRMLVPRAKQMIEMFERRNDKDGISMVVDHCVMYYDHVIIWDALKDMDPKYADMIRGRALELGH